MKTTYTYYKNSNTGELIKKVQHISEYIKNIPDSFYDAFGKSVENPNLTGFVEISEKKFNRESKKQKKIKHENISR
jgi:hypothetical protein